MKAKTISFKRGQNPHQSLSIGGFQPFKTGDKIKMLSGGPNWTNGDILIYTEEDDNNYASFYKKGLNANMDVVLLDVDKDTNIAEFLEYMSWLYKNPNDWERIT